MAANRHNQVPFTGKIISDVRGQMTVELCMFLPVATVVALIAINAALFFSSCAEFDRTSRNSVRVHATSLTYGATSADAANAIQADLDAAFSSDNSTSEVTVTSNADGYNTYTMTLHFRPTLFGLGLRDEFMGVAVPALQHTSRLTVSPYKPGILF